MPKITTKLKMRLVTMNILSANRMPAKNTNETLCQILFKLIPA